MKWFSEGTVLGALGFVPRPIRRVLFSCASTLRLKGLERRPGPEWMTLFITNYCNARCQHCFYWEELNSKAQEMTVGEYETMFRSVDRPLRTIRLSGGEPFLRKDLPDFYLMLDRLRKTTKLSIPTHGMLEVLTPIGRMLRESRHHTCLNVSVSLDGLAETHERFRGIPGGFARAVANLRMMVDLERQFPFFEVSVSTTVTRHNLGELSELVRFIRHDVGVTRYGFDHIRSSQTDLYDIDPAIVADFHPPATEEQETDKAKRFLRVGELPPDPAMFDVEQMGQVNKVLEQLVGGRSADRVLVTRLELQRRVKASQHRVIPCVAGRADCVIYPNGDVSVCEFTKPFANLREFGFNFRRLWVSPQAEAMRAQTTTCGCTHPCHMSDSMAYDASSLVELTSRYPRSERQQLRKVPV